MKLTTAAVAAILSVGLLAGCGSDKKAAPSSDAASNASSTDIESRAVSESGCQNAQKDEKNQQIYARAIYHCTGMDLYVFNSSSARDSWLKIAAEFGTVELKRGDTWLAVKQNG